MANQFREPNHMDIMIEDSKKVLIGTIRIKPNGILWSNANETGFRRATLDEFKEWMKNKKKVKQ